MDPNVGVCVTHFETVAIQYTQRPCWVPQHPQLQPKIHPSSILDPEKSGNCSQIRINSLDAQDLTVTEPWQ